MRRRPVATLPVAASPESASLPGIPDALLSANQGADVHDHGNASRGDAAPEALGPGLPAMVPAGGPDLWQMERCVWQTGAGDGVWLEQRLITTPRALDHGPTDQGLERLAQREFGDRGAPVEVGRVAVDGLPSIRVVSKRLDSAGGLYGVGVLVVPRREVSVVLRVTCGGTEAQWQRRTVEVFAIAMRDGHPPDAYPGFRVGTARALEADPADAGDWDAMFPTHPLSRVRAHLRRLADGVRLDPAFRALPVGRFSRRGPQPHRPDGPRRGPDRR